MRFNVGQKVRVKEVCSGGNFEEGDIVEITGIGFEDETDCYAATSPYDGETWYLDEDEVEPITNGDNIRSMSNEELLNFMICTVGNAVLCRAIGTKPKFFTLEWLNSPMGSE